MIYISTYRTIIRWTIIASRARSSEAYLELLLIRIHRSAVGGPLRR